MKRIAVAAAAALCACAAKAADVTLYKDRDFRGASQVVKGEVAHLEDGFAREAASLKVRGGFWVACTRDHFRGECYALPPGDYPRLEPELDRRIVALRFLGTLEMLSRAEPTASRGAPSPKFPP